MSNVGGSQSEGGAEWLCLAAAQIIERWSALERASADLCLLLSGRHISEESTVEFLEQRMPSDRRVALKEASSLAPSTTRGRIEDLLSRTMALEPSSHLIAQGFASSSADGSWLRKWRNPYHSMHSLASDPEGMTLGQMCALSEQIEELQNIATGLTAALASSPETLAQDRSA